MATLLLDPSATTDPKERSACDKSFAAHLNRTHIDADRIFTVLMRIQFFALVGAAIWITPWTWQGQSSSVHVHVWAALGLGSLITLVPAALGRLYPGTALTRYTFAVCQMLVSALLIHISGGRVETHFHIFGSLAFLSVYRDIRVILVSTAVIAVEHLARSYWMPFSVFGVNNVAILRAFEHAGYVVFEDIVLICIIVQNRRDMRRASAFQVSLENKSQQLEADVQKLCQVVGKAAQGDLVRNGRVELQTNELRTLEASLDQMFADFCSALSEINDGAKIVRSTSSVASQRSSSVSQHAIQQQAAVTQITDATVELRRGIETIHDLCRRLSDASSEAFELAAQSEAAMSKSEESIGAMEGSSERMLGSIQDIQEIAEQTKLLALNATIEAARAGEFGKGFSVVAAEVRDLAHRCNESADAVARLLGESTAAINQGAMHSRETAEHLSRIVVSVREFGRDLSQITEVAEKQSVTAVQVSEATESVAVSSKDAVNHSADINNQCRDLDELAASLEQTLRRFKTQPV